MKIILAALLLQSFAYADSLECPAAAPLKIEKTLPIGNEVNYFMRSAPDTQEVGFATKSGNQILNLKTNKSTQVAGFIDPVLSPDGQLVSIPLSFMKNPKNNTLEEVSKTAPKYMILGTNVYECKAINDCLKAENITIDQVKKSGQTYSEQMMTFHLKTDGKLERIYRDEALQFNYQSIGKLRTTDKIATYRLLYESPDGLGFRDYDLNTKERSIKPVAGIRQVCPQTKLALPSLSKTGDEIIGYDYKQGATKIISIGADGTKCDVVDSIPTLIGKTDFSPDSQSITFHVDVAKDSKIFASPDGSNNMQVFVYDRKTKSFTAVSTDQKQNSYYPVFLDNKRIAFISATKSKKPSFFINIAAVPTQAQLKCKDCFEPAKQTGQIAALIGAIKMNKCKDNDKPIYRKAITTFSQINVETCEALVTSCNNDCIKTALQKIDRSTETRKKEAAKADEKLEPEMWSNSKLELITQQNLTQFCKDYKEQNPTKTGAPSSSKSEKVNKVK